jgi:hypothetical protein
MDSSAGAWDGLRRGGRRRRAERRLRTVMAVPACLLLRATGEVGKGRLGVGTGVAGMRGSFLGRGSGAETTEPHDERAHGTPCGLAPGTCDVGGSWWSPHGTRQSPARASALGATGSTLARLRHRRARWRLGARGQGFGRGVAEAGPVRPRGRSTASAPARMQRRGGGWGRARLGRPARRRHTRVWGWDARCRVGRRGAGPRLVAWAGVGCGRGVTLGCARRVGQGKGARWASRRGKGRGPVLGWETKLGREQAKREWVLISILFIYFFSFSLFFISILSDLISSSSTNS